MSSLDSPAFATRSKKATVATSVGRASMGASTLPPGFDDKDAVAVSPCDCETCVICQEAMDVPSAIVHLDCSHAFHAQCVVTHLQRDRRCPICRHRVPNTDDSDDDSESVASEMEFNYEASFNTAMTAAKAAVPQNPAVEKMFANVSRWQQEAADARRVVRETHNILRPLEDEVEDILDQCSDALWDTFERQNKRILETLDKAKQSLKKARSYAHAGKLRIAKEYGYLTPAQTGSR